MRRTLARRVEENDLNEEIPTQVKQIFKIPLYAQNDKVLIVERGNEVPVVPQKMANGEIREPLLTLARAMTIQVNRDIWPRVNIMESTITSTWRNFLRMNPPFCFGSKVGQDPHAFLVEVYKIVHAMRVTSREKVVLSLYELNDASQVWFTQWKDSSPIISGPFEWE